MNYLETNIILNQVQNYNLKISGVAPRKRSDLWDEGGKLKLTIAIGDQKW